MRYFLLKTLTDEMRIMLPVLNGVVLVMTKDRPISGQEKALAEGNYSPYQAKHMKAD